MRVQKLLRGWKPLVLSLVYFYAQNLFVKKKLVLNCTDNLILVVIAVLPHRKFFFLHCFSTSSLTLPWAIAGFLHNFILLPQLMAEWFTTHSFNFYLGFSVTVLPHYGFEPVFFYLQAFFTLHSFPTFWLVLWLRSRQ